MEIKQERDILKYLFAILLLTLLILTSTLVQASSIALAVAPSYTSVIDDLSKDASFQFGAYTENANDYSIQVIQLAESESGELFVYTYQPCQKTYPLVATEINMTFSESADGTKLYLLTQINTWGVFGKYLVNDLKASTAQVRYYNITSIYRSFIFGIDEKPDNDNEKTAIAYPVGKLYKVTEQNGDIKYDCKKVDVVQIKNPVAGYLEYFDGVKWYPTSCDGHYVAFSTDRKIDELLEADVTYMERSKSETVPAFMGGTKYGAPVQSYKTVKHDEKGSNTADGWFAEKFEWERIQTTENFINSEKLSSEAKSKLAGSKWVLRFLETQLTVISGGVATTTYSTEVYDVSVLRLKFVTDDVVYDLGAVSDKVTEGDKPDNPYQASDSVPFLQYVWNCVVKLLTGKADVIETVVAAVALLIVLVALPLGVTILSIAVPVVGTVIKTIFWVMVLPFKVIVRLLKGKGKTKG